MSEPGSTPEAPWKQRFRVPAIRWVQVASGDPRRGLACTNRDGEYQLYAWDVPTGDLRPVTDRPGGVATGWLAPDGSSIVWLQDTGGSEIGHFVRASWDGGEPEDLTPTLPPYASFSADTSLDGRFLSVVADADGSHLVVVDAGPFSPARIVWSTTKLCWGAAITADGALGVACVASHSEEPRMNLVAIDLSSGAVVGELWDGEGTSILEALGAPVAARRWVAAVSDRSGSSRPFIWDIDTDERTDIELPGAEGDVVPVAWSPDGDRLLLREIWRAVDSLWLYNVGRSEAVRLAHPSGTYGVASFGPTGEILACRETARDPAHVVALDETGALLNVALEAGGAPASISWRSVDLEGANGESIQMWVSVPEGVGPFPTVIETHGGPQAVAQERYMPRAQVWTDHGYAYASVNYHGSWGFGRAFLESIWGHPGDLEIDDLVAARAWLIAEGIADQAMILLTGWSYGGYLTLQAMGRRPNLWAGGLAGVAIADWTLMYRDGSDALKAYQVGLLGGMPDEQPDVYRAASPISSVGQLQAPVLVIQGRNDSRCPASQMLAYEAAARAAGKDVTIEWFDSGHAMSSDVEASIRHAESMLAFADRTLTGVLS